MISARFSEFSERHLVFCVGLFVIPFNLSSCFFYRLQHFDRRLCETSVEGDNLLGALNQVDEFGLHACLVAELCRIELSKDGFRLVEDHEVEALILKAPQRIDLNNLHNALFDFDVPLLVTVVCHGNPCFGIPGHPRSGECLSHR